MKVCPKCKIEYEDTKEFCIYCGAKLVRISVIDALDSLTRILSEEIGKIRKNKEKIEKLKNVELEINTDNISKFAEKIKMLSDDLNKYSIMIENLSQDVSNLKKEIKYMKDKLPKEIQAQIAKGLIE